MPTLRAPFVLASGLLLGACTPAPEPAPAAAKAPEADQKLEPEPEPARAQPVEVAPEPLPSPLRVVAVREGLVTLLRQRDAPLLVLDGEPVPLVDGSFSRHP